jgi:protein-S-isoprenylcysteine O-methyltransferase Ste14
MARPARPLASPQKPDPRGRLLEKRPEDLALDFLIGLVWAICAALYLVRVLRGSGLVYLGQMGIMTVFAALFLLRRPARKTGKLWESALAVAAAWMPIALRPAPGDFTFLGDALQIIGLVGMLIAVLSLGRSFGVAPADRGLRTTGLYGWLRHPLYAMEITVFAGFLIANPCWWNLAILTLNTLLQVVRITREERILEGYAGYASRVRWRLVPLVW